MASQNFSMQFKTALLMENN